MNEQKKELNDILKELHKVLDDLSTDTGIKKDISETVLEDLKNKIIQKKDNINSADTTIVTSDISDKKDENNIAASNVSDMPSQNLEVEKKVSEEKKLESNEPSSKKTEDVDEQIKRESLPIGQQNVENKSTISESKVVEEDISKPENVSVLKKEPSTVNEQSSNNANQNVVNTIFIYPVSVPESRDIFYEQVNNTLKRVSKKPAEMKPIFEISFTDPENDLEKHYQEILSKIKSNDVKAVFIITNESVSLDDFVSKFLNEVFMIKPIKYSELKTKSIYLDIAIDILLTLK